MQTILGAFDDRQTAQRAVDQLLARGFTDASIHLQTGATSDSPAADTATNRGMVASVRNFFSSLFGESEEKEHAGNYAEAVRRGSSVVAVDTSDDSEVQMAESIMGQLGAINVENRAE
jgi:cytosine/adenosine deaminase-related metal-dependent hydrolase